MAYDGLLLVGLWMVAGLPFVLLAARQDLLATGTLRLLFQGYLLLIGFADGIEARAACPLTLIPSPACGRGRRAECAARMTGKIGPVCGFLFYGWFWTHGGQTLGMRTWRLRLVRADGGPITWHITAIRFGSALLALAPLGLGLWWALFDKDKRAWHDRLSGTRLIVTPKPT
jgi:hypothetical protein